MSDQLRMALEACIPALEHLGLAKSTRLYALEQARAALAQPAAVQGWRPIASVPKDMMPRLYLVDGFCVQAFVDATGKLMVQSEISPHWRAMRGKPSHWHPLPQPPEAAQASATEMDHRSGGIGGTTECQGKEGGSAAVAADARYEWLRERFLGADFDWGSCAEDGTHGTPVLLFKFDGTDVWGCLDATIDAARSTPSPAQAEPPCACKDRALKDCPGEWEPGCDLGNNPAYVKAHQETPEERAALDAALAAQAEPAASAGERTSAVEFAEQAQQIEDPTDEKQAAYRKMAGLGQEPRLRTELVARETQRLRELMAAEHAARAAVPVEQQQAGEWQWVPKEPTFEMLQAAEDADDNSSFRESRMYKAMLAAAPAQPQPAVEQQAAEAEAVACVVTVAQGRNAGKYAQLLRELPNGTKLYTRPAAQQVRALTGPREFYRHKRTGGEYEVICNAQNEADSAVVMVVYRNVKTGERWVRPASEFNDGRFERIPAPAGIPGDGEDAATRAGRADAERALRKDSGHA